MAIYKQNEQTQQKKKKEKNLLVAIAFKKNVLNLANAMDIFFGTVIFLKNLTLFYLQVVVTERS